MNHLKYSYPPKFIPPFLVKWMVCPRIFFHDSGFIHRWAWGKGIEKYYFVKLTQLKHDFPDPEEWRQFLYTRHYVILYSYPTIAKNVRGGSLYLKHWKYSYVFPNYQVDCKCYLKKKIDPNPLHRGKNHSFFLFFSFYIFEFLIQIDQKRELKNKQKFWFFCNYIMCSIQNQSLHLMDGLRRLVFGYLFLFIYYPKSILVTLNLHKYFTHAQL